MAKKETKPQAQPKESKKKRVVVVLFDKYLSTLSSSETAAIEEKGEVLAIPGFKKFLDRLNQTQIVELL